MSPNQQINTLDEGCLVELLQRRFTGQVSVIEDDESTPANDDDIMDAPDPIEDDHDPKWDDSRECAEDPEYGDAPSVSHEKARLSPREKNRAAIRAKSPVTLSDAECDSISRLSIEADGFQALCGKCHDEKTAEEREGRKAAEHYIDGLFIKAGVTRPAS